MLAALAFLTPLRVGRAATAAPDGRTFAWFPLAGAAIGLLVGAVWWGAGELWPPAVAAALAVTADVLVTGALHVDGLADTADGVLPHLPADRRLAVMSEPDVGAFGVVAVVITLLSRWSALGSLAPDPLLVAGLWCASRTGMAVVARSVHYAREEGLASDFLGPGPAAPVLAVAGAVIAVPLVVVAASGVGALALVAVAVVMTGVVAIARRQIGGFTGDVLGAAGILGETAGLLVAAARW